MVLFYHKRLEEVAKTSSMSNYAFKVFCDVHGQFFKLNTLGK